jgi:hypothetical protein
MPRYRTPPSWRRRKGGRVSGAWWGQPTGPAHWPNPNHLVSGTNTPREIPHGPRASRRRAKCAPGSRRVAPRARQSSRPTATALIARTCLTRSGASSTYSTRLKRSIVRSSMKATCSARANEKPAESRAQRCPDPQEAAGAVAPNARGGPPWPARQCLRRSSISQPFGSQPKRGEQKQRALTRTVSQFGVRSRNHRLRLCPGAGG